MSSRTVKTVPGANSFYVKTAANLLSCIRNISVVKPRKNKSYLPIENDQVCVVLPVYIIFRATRWKQCFKKSSRATNCQREPFACRKRRYPWIRWSLVVCLHQNSKILALDSPLSKNTSNCSICNRWSQCWNVPTLMEQDSKWLSNLSHL